MLARMKRHAKFLLILLRNFVGCAFVLSIVMAAVASQQGMSIHDVFSWESLSGGIKTCILLALTFLPYGLTLWETDVEKKDG